MSQQVIGVGASANDHTGDPDRTAFQKCNSNFTELYSTVNGLAPVATAGTYASLTGKPTLGTAAALDVPASGDASSSQVVKGNDTRLGGPGPRGYVPALKYKWDAAATSTPAAGHASVNGSTLYVHGTDENGVGLGNVLGQVKAGSVVLVQKRADSAVYAIAQVTADAGVSGSVYAVPIGTPSTGGSLATDDEVDILFGLAGPKGDTGAAGSNGTNGQGVPTGGATGEVLGKQSGTDFDTMWFGFNAPNLAYGATTPANWAGGTPPTTAQAALDRIAAALTTLGQSP